MFIIQQEDIVKINIPVKYRGINPNTGKYGDLHEKLEDVIPFPSTKESINEINRLINTMRKTGREGIHPDNANKKFTILDVDDDNIIRNKYSLDEWFDNSKNKLEW